MPKKVTRKPVPKYTIHKYSVIRIDEEDLREKLFECIPDRWFVDESKRSCYWPPSTGKSFTLRAINCEKPDDTWNIYECTVVSEEHLTYQSGFKIVQEKCRQKYNTSSAEEHITAAAYKREHPVLALLQNDGDIEQIFAVPNTTAKKQMQNKGQKKSSEISSESSRDLCFPKGKSTECLTIDKEPEQSTPQRIELVDDLESENRSNSPVLVAALNSMSASPQNTSNGIEISMPSVAVATSNSSNKNQLRSSGLKRKSLSSKSRLRRSRSSSGVSNVSRSNRRSCSSGSGSVSGKRSHSSRSSSFVFQRSGNKRKNSSRRWSRCSFSSGSSKSSASGKKRSPSGVSQRSRSSSKEDSRSSSIEPNQSAARNRNSDMSRNKRKDSARRSGRRYFSSCSSKNSGSGKKRSHSSRSSSGVSQRSRSILKRYGRSSSIESNRSAARNRNPKISRNKRKDSSRCSNRRSCSSASSESLVSRKKRSHSSPSSTSKVSQRSHSSSKRASPSPYRSIQPNRFIEKKLSFAANKNSKMSKHKIMSGDSPLCKQPVTHPKTNKHTHSRENHPEKSLAERFMDGRKRSHSPYSESDNLKRSRINPHHSEITAVRKQCDTLSRRLSKSPHQSYNNLNNCVVGDDSYRQQNIDLLGTQSTTKNYLTADPTIRDLRKLIGKINDTIERDHEQLKQYDRRLQRVEVTVNKILVLVCDLNGAAPEDDLNDKRFEVPELPIQSMKELSMMKKKLKNKEFEAFYLQHEKEFCCPTKNASDTATTSKYLKRFISLRVRSKLTLKENDEGDTLYDDYHQVYLFLINVMKAGYRTAKKTITSNEAHTALRIVWGRSKQQYRESKPKRK